MPTQNGPQAPCFCAGGNEVSDVLDHCTVSVQARFWSYFTSTILLVPDVLL
jgi:hypothetical protein